MFWDEFGVNVRKLTMPNTSKNYFTRVCNSCSHWIERFTSHQGGNVAIIFAATVMPALFAVGAAIDYSRGSQVGTSLQAALDSTALHLALLPQSTSQSTLDSAAAEYFVQNFQGDIGATLGSVQVVRDGPSITLAVEASMETMFMGIASITELEIRAVSEVLQGGGTIEVAMVLDNSGSMRGGKLSALKSASQGLVDTLYDGLPPSSSDLSFSLTPFATFVDIGENHANEPWMDRFGQSSIHNENFDTPANRFELFDNITNVQWEGCVEARPYPLDVQDTPPTSANPDTLYVPAFAPDHPDNAGPNWKYVNRYLPDQISGSWSTRQENVAKYAPGVTAVPGYFRTSYNIGPSFLCRQADLMPLTSSQSTISSGISSMVARGSTNIVQGLVWGWRTLSPGEPFTEGRSYNDSRNQKILILLTDGKNWMSSIGSPNITLYSAYGFAKDGRLGTTSSSNSYLSHRMNLRTAEACENIKDAGITIYAITFDLNDSTTQDLMRECASLPGNYYNSPSASQLDDVFDEIAKKLQKLRITR